uniref:Uncharacterized protein n=1 Tax=viral metagenome TaxID=1070528 RepID=A0A6M3K8R9_9ZZZZ
MPAEDYKPRLSIEITDEQFADLQRLTSHGLKKAIFGVIIDDVIRLLKSHGDVFIGAVLSRQLKLEEYSIPIKKKRK